MWRVRQLLLQDRVRGRAWKIYCSVLKFPLLVVLLLPYLRIDLCRSRRTIDLFHIQTIT